MGDSHLTYCPQCGYEKVHQASWGRTGITIIAFWPIEEHSHKTYDNRFIFQARYRTACAHAHYDLQIIEEPSQAEIPEGRPVIAVEEPDFTIGVEQLHKFKHPTDATYIVGNSFYRYPSQHFNVDHRVGISYDDPNIGDYSPFYGDQLIPIIWYDRKLKSEILRGNR